MQSFVRAYPELVKLLSTDHLDCITMSLVYDVQTHLDDTLTR